MIGKYPVRGLLTFLVVAPVLLAQFGGSVSGRVVGEDGKGKAGMMVTVLRRPAPDVGVIPPSVSSALTDNDGVFLLQKFAPGEYRLCAHLPGSDIVNPCEWETSYTGFLLEAFETKTGVTIPVERGHRVKVRVVDTGELLDKHAGKTRGAGLQLGYWQNRKPFQALEPKMKGKNQWEYEFIAPFGKPVEVGVYTGFFRIEDSRGQELDEMKRAPLSVSRQQIGQAEVVLHVRGLK